LLDFWFFYAFAILVLGGAILTVALRSAVHCAIGLMGSLIGTAGLFLLQRAEFLFVAQIILYVGGILLLFLFVIMLVNLDIAVAGRSFQRSWPLALFCIAVVAVELAWLAHTGVRLDIPVQAPGAPLGNTEEIGSLLLTGYLLPFEIASILLLVAVVGAVVMGKEHRA
jgi:NADH-quinone oxidoreductase subunit J